MKKLTATCIDIPLRMALLQTIHLVLGLLPFHIPKLCCVVGLSSVFAVISCSYYIHNTMHGLNDT